MPLWLLTGRHQANFSRHSRAVEEHCARTLAMGPSRLAVPRPSPSLPFSLSSLSLPPKDYHDCWQHAAQWYHRTAGIFWLTYAVDLLLMLHMYLGASTLGPHACAADPAPFFLEEANFRP